MADWAKFSSRCQASLWRTRESSAPHPVKRMLTAFLQRGQKVEITPSTAPNQDHPFIPLSESQRPSGWRTARHPVVSSPPPTLEAVRKGLGRGLKRQHLQRGNMVK